MDRTQARLRDGRANPEYNRAYYEAHKEEIAIKNHARYERVMSTPGLAEARRARCSAATRQYRQRHPEREKLTRRDAYVSHRRRAFELLGGAVCVRCGCDVIEFLELNHINGGGCKEHREVGNSILGMIINGQRGPEGYEVLCRVCNALDYLARKNPEKACGFSVHYTGGKAEKA